MTSGLESRWDDAVERAWNEFRQRLGDRLAELDEHDAVLVEVAHEDDDGATVVPYCQALGASGELRVEAVSNLFLTEELELTPEQELGLTELGFEAPSGSRPNFWLDLEQREADRAAVLMVRALREVYGVLHPVYLDAGGLEPQPEPQATDAVDADEERTTFPEAPDDVRRALGSAAAVLLGQEPAWDDDGDLVIATEKSVLYITVSSAQPRILMHAPLLVEVVDELRAVSEVNLLNQREFGLTFVFSDGRVAVRRELPVGAFVPGEIRAETQRLADNLDGWISDLQVRVGGRAPLDEGPARPPQAAPAPASGETEPEDEQFAQAMRVLRELESEERGSVDPATMARIFHSDRDLLLEAIRHTVSRATQWGSRRRRAEREDKADYARYCSGQQRYYHALRGRIRHALRLTVQATVPRDRQTQLTLFAEDEASA